MERRNEQSPSHIDQYDVRLKSTWEALHRSQLVITKQPTESNLKEFAGILDKLLPISAADRILWDFIKFEYTRAPAAFFRYIESAVMSHYTILVGGMTLAKELHIDSIVSVRLGGPSDKKYFEVKARQPSSSVDLSTSIPSPIVRPATPPSLPTSPAIPPIISTPLPVTSIPPLSTPLPVTSTPSSLPIPSPLPCNNSAAQSLSNDAVSKPHNADVSPYEGMPDLLPVPSKRHEQPHKSDTSDRKVRTNKGKDKTQGRRARDERKRRPAAAPPTSILRRPERQTNTRPTNTTVRPIPPLSSAACRSMMRTTAPIAPIVHRNTAADFPSLPTPSLPVTSLPVTSTPSSPSSPSSPSTIVSTPALVPPAQYQPVVESNNSASKLNWADESSE